MTLWGPSARPWAAAVCLSLAALSAQAFEAQTKLTNVPLQDRDVGTALTRGLQNDFDRVFPDRQYGVFVQVDNIQSGDKDFVYLNLGLTRRLPDGRHLAPHATASSLAFMPANTARDQQVQFLIEQLQGLAQKFSAAMIQNQGRVR